jgi:exodeoxyribonuclease VII large subunit
MENERLRMNALTGRLPVTAALSVQNHRMYLQSLAQRLLPATEMFIKEQKHRLEIIKGKMDAASPEKILAMGYSITRVNGKAVRSVADVKPGDEVTTAVAGGEFTSIVKNKKV